MSNSFSMVKFNDNIHKLLFSCLFTIAIYILVVTVVNSFDLPVELLFEYTNSFFIPRSMVAVSVLALLTIFPGIGGGYLNLPLSLICGFLIALWTGLFAGIVLPTMTMTTLLFAAFTGGLWIALPSGIVYGLIGVVSAFVGYHLSQDEQ